MTQRERASKKAPHTSERASDREQNASAVFFRKGASRREREREKSKGTLVGGENWSDRMFFHVRREKNVVLEPRHFGARMKDVIMEKIKLEVRPFIY